MPLWSIGRPSRRAGFTAVELMIVVVIVGVLTVVAIPRFSVWRERGSVGAARQQIVSAIATARSSAVQRGTRATFKVSGNTIRAWAMSPAGDTVFVIPLVRLDSTLNTTITLRNAADTAIVFDGRGFSRRSSGGVYRYILENGKHRDSVCVGSGGTVLPRRCTP